MSKILELREKRAKAWDTAKAFLDDRRGTDGLLSAEDATSYDKMEVDIVNLGKEVARLERQEAIDTELNHPTSSPLTGKPAVQDADTKTGRASNAYRMEFFGALRGKPMPFDVNVNDCMLWDQAVRLLNSDGDPLVPISADPVKKYDGLTYAGAYKSPEGEEMIIGHYLYSKNESGVYNYYLRIYKWSKVGVFQNFTDVNLTQSLKDEYNSAFTYSEINGDSIFTDGKITVVGYNTRLDSTTKENIYTSKLVQFNVDGSVARVLEIKPKIGNCTWFGAKGMDSGNIERRCYANSIRLNNSKLYISYYGVQGGTTFWQCITQGGNLIEPYRKFFSCNDGNYVPCNILGTDRYVVKYGDARSNYYRFMIMNALTSRPIGTHTRLSQPVEKTEANTMKVQYMFEIDLPVYGEDYY